MNIEKMKELNNVLDQMRLKDLRSWILMVPNSIGETALVCGFSKGFIEQHGYGITLVIIENHSCIASMYPGRFNAVITAPMQLMRDFSDFGFIPPNHFDIDFPFNTWPLQYGDGRLYELGNLYCRGHGRGGLSFTDLYRYILRLSWDTPIERPIIQDEVRKKAIEIANRHGIIQGQSVILFPGSNSSISAPYPFWIAISDLFRIKKGFKVFSNCSGAGIFPGDMPIPGSDRLDLPIDIALAISEFAGHMVIGANGLSMMALFSRINCKIDIILVNTITSNPSLGFKKVNFINSSSRLNIPEICCDRHNLSEWTLPTEKNIVSLGKAALDIVEGNRSSDFLLTHEMISDYMSNKGFEWARSLIF